MSEAPGMLLSDVSNIPAREVNNNNNNNNRSVEPSRSAATMNLASEVQRVTPPSACTSIKATAQKAKPRTAPVPRSWSSRPAGSRAGGRVPAGSACPASAHWQCGRSASTAPGQSRECHTLRHTHKIVAEFDRHMRTSTVRSRLTSDDKQTRQPSKHPKLDLEAQKHCKNCKKGSPAPPGGLPGIPPVCHPGTPWGGSCGRCGSPQRRRWRTG
jgi:hypothetical protein